MNLPNRLTIARFFLTLLFVAAFSVDWAFPYTAGLFLFVVASLTDYADGEIARRYGLVTNFGKLMDPLADKVLLAAAFICLVSIGSFPAWVAILIVAREFLITGLRLLAAAQGVVISADNLGKHKTIWQIVAVLFFLCLGTLREISAPPVVRLLNDWHRASVVGGHVLIGFALVLTLYSGLAYLWRNRHLLRES